jgi:SAM-dependent methyltransferase
VAADAYGKFMGRFSQPLAAELVRVLEPRPGDRVLDVGCGPGAVTALLVDRLGAGAVCAIDPSEPFVAAARAQMPGVDIRLGASETLPWPDHAFDQTVAQLVVHFMNDPQAGVREMRRVTRPGGVVAASVWDFGGGTSPLAVFWDAVRDMEPGHPGESGLFGAQQGQLVALFESAGISAVRESLLTVRVPIASFDEWWAPFELGVGPAGEYVAKLDDASRNELRDRCAHRLPEGTFEAGASAWLAVGRA